MLTPEHPAAWHSDDYIKHWARNHCLNRYPVALVPLRTSNMTQEDTAEIGFFIDGEPVVRYKRQKIFNMPKPTDDVSARRLAVSRMLYIISEGLADGSLSEYHFKFNVRQHREEKRDWCNKILSTGPAKVEVNFSIDMDESRFREFYAARSQQIEEALLETANGGGLTLEHSSIDNAEGGPRNED